MIPALLAAALAGPVQCDPEQAATVLREARIAEDRAPVSHPELVPGLARAAATASPELTTALASLCAGESPDLSLVVGESWEEASHAAHTVFVTRTESRGCSLHDRTLAISVGVSPEGVRYDLRDDREHPTRTPLGECREVARWGEERVLGGEGSAARLVLVTEHEGDRLLASRIVGRRASVAGWRDEVLIEPAPRRLLDPSAPGPIAAMTETGERWIVETLGREGSGEGCRPVTGQRVWRPSDRGWTLAEGDEALALLASRGLWRYAGSDGWIAVVAQDDSEDTILLEARVKRLVRRNGVEPLLLQSSSFPSLNPGFAVAVLGPYPSEDRARSALREFRGGGRRYVKRAWEAVDACEDR